MGAHQSTWNIEDNIHNPVGELEASLYTRRPELQRKNALELQPADLLSPSPTLSVPPPNGAPSLPSLPPSLSCQEQLPGGQPTSLEALMHIPRILDHLLPFLMGTPLLNFMTCSTVCFVRIVGWMREKCMALDRQFEETYRDILVIDKSTLKFEPVYIAEKAVRMDWVIYAKVLPACTNRCTQIGYSFGYVDGTTNRSCLSSNSNSPTVSTIASGKHSPGGDGAGSDRSTGSSSDNNSNISDVTSTTGDAPVARHPNVSSTSGAFSSRRLNNSKSFSSSAPRRSKSTLSSTCSIVAPVNSSYEGGRGAPRSYQVSFQFNAYRKGTSRQLWVHKDICRFHGDETKVAAMCSIGSVCVDDRIEVAVNLLNAFGLVNWNSIRWSRSASVNLGYNPQLAKSCPIESTHKDWFDMDKFQAMTTERLRQSESFAPYLHHVHTSFAGVDIAIRKTEYTATTEGCMGEKAERAWGMPWEIVPQDSPIVCSLNRLGLQHDRGLSVQLRVGDRVMYYLSQGGANPS